MYNAQATVVENMPEMAAVYGFKGNSPLNQLSYYHVICGLPSDAAHDIFEGVACHVMKLVITALITQGAFDLGCLNSQSLNFSYSQIDKANKPRTLPNHWLTFVSN